MQLTTTQQHIFDKIETTTENFFVTGKPGTGKSVLTNHLRNNGTKFYHIAAPTGLAALNVAGRTLHSLFRLPIIEGIIPPDYNPYPKDDKTIKNIKYNIKHLIIDEVSMVRADMFDYLNRLLMYCKDSDKPFGGVQLILVGDFFQLPPVTKALDNKELKDHGYNSPFVFDSASWSAGFNVVGLSEVLRQKGDNKFIKLLNRARTGEITLDDCRLLNENVRETDNKVIQLCGTNHLADQINFGHLRSIAGEPEKFTGVKFGSWPALPCDDVVQIKVGARVMVRKNNADVPMGTRDGESRIVNGSLGTVVEINRNQDKNAEHVVVELDNGETVPIFHQRWEHKIKERGVDGQWEERVVASFEQMPLMLAWAISMHKSQGQSFDNVSIDPSKIFAPGQMYVALSRARTLAGTTFTSPVRTKHFWANADVVEFYKKNKIK